MRSSGLSPLASGYDCQAYALPPNDCALMFPPSPERSTSSNNFNSRISWVGSPTSSVLRPSATSDNKFDSTVKNWVCKEKIGQGAQGSVYRCEERKTGREVAVKVVWTKELCPLAVEAVKREVLTMKRLRHKHLVRYLLATEKKQSELRIYMEYASGGSLSSHLSRFGALPLTLVKRFTRQLCEALQYLHRNGIAHRDIKCANILLATSKGKAQVDSCTVVKLADFGAFKVIGCASLVGGLKGTPHWMAPEVIRQQNMEDDGNHERWFRADVWSLGCAVLEMITGHSPWKQFSNPFSAMYQIVSSDSTPTIPSDISNEATSFLQLCLQRNPEHRATVTQLLTHSFLRVVAESKVKSSKHRIKRQAKRVGTTTKRCNQQSLQSLSTPKSENSGNLVPELEPHETLAIQSDIWSRDKNKSANIKNLSLRGLLDDSNKKTRHATPLNDAPAEKLGPHVAPRLKPLRKINNLIATMSTNQVTNMSSSATNKVLVPPKALSGLPAVPNRLLQLVDQRHVNGSKSSSISSIRLRRISTAPSATTNLETSDEGAIRLPSLSVRPRSSAFSS